VGGQKTKARLVGLGWGGREETPLKTPQGSGWSKEEDGLRKSGFFRKGDRGKKKLARPKGKRGGKTGGKIALTKGL